MIKKLLSFEYMGLPQWGVLTADESGIYSTISLEEAFFLPFPETLLEFIEQGNEGILALATAVEKNEEEQLVTPIPLDAVRILPPIPQPARNIFCVGKNYSDHIKEFDRTALADIPKKPVIFTKAASSVIGPEASIDLHEDITSMVDYEGELAVIIGKAGTRITAEEAMDHVYGYTILNDVSARDVQADHIQWFLGKSMDTFCPMGPYILMRDAAPSQFTVTTKVNGEVRQDDSTEQFIFSLPEIIRTLSAGMTLQPGDIIATGTPAGVGVGFKPPRLLKSGDVVEITISDIGTLRNPVK